MHSYLKYLMYRRALLVMMVLVMLGSTTATLAASSSISRSYSTQQEIVNGSLVSLAGDKSRLVVPANRENGDKLIGLAVGDNESILAISPKDAAVQVAITGVATALVSTVNGPIKVGDQVSVSPFSGIGMASEPRARIIGLAQSELTDASPDLTKREVVDKFGKKQTIKVGYMQVNIAIGPPANNTDGVDEGFLQRSAKAVTGKDISATRVVIGSFVALIAIVALIVLIYSTIYATIIAIGRNPLARRAVFRTLTGAMLMALIVALVAIGALYLILG